MKVKFEQLFAELTERQFSVIESPVQIGDKTYYGGKKFGPTFKILGRKIVDLVGLEFEVEVGPKDVQMIKKVYFRNESEARGV
jgi:hypothetical protein